MPLTDTAIRKIKPSDKTQRLYDERGLYLEVAPSGSKLWRFKYRYGSKVPPRLPPSDHRIAIDGPGQPRSC